MNDYEKDNLAAKIMAQHKELAALLAADCGFAVGERVTINDKPPITFYIEYFELRDTWKEGLANNTPAQEWILATLDSRDRLQKGARVALSDLTKVKPLTPKYRGEYDKEKI